LVRIFNSHLCFGEKNDAAFIVFYLLHFSQQWGFIRAKSLHP
jgi:hypothetical protein